VTRYIHHVRIATIVGLVSIAALALPAAPAGAGQTHHKKATVITEPATRVTDSQATLHGNISAFGGFKKYFFEYGTTPGLGQTTPVVSLNVCPPGAPTGTYCECPPGTTNGAYCECPPGTANRAYCVNQNRIPVSAQIKGLNPHTTYYFLLVAVGRHDKQTLGAEKTFKTIGTGQHHHRQ
jgi:hypothetical protein